MNHEQINKKISQLKRLEGKAISLQIKMDKIRDKWEKINEAIKNTDEWKNSCHESDMHPNYNFKDVLA